MQKRRFLTILVTLLFNFHFAKASSDSCMEGKSKKWLPVISIQTVKKIRHNEQYPGKYKIFTEIEGQILTKKEVRDIVRPGEKESNNWDSVQIKRRGNSSDHFDKKQYLLKFQQAGGKKKDVSIGGLPEDSRWVLHAPFVDKSRSRNLVAYRLGREIGEDRGEKYFAPKTKPYELFINNEYLGTYLIVEKLTRTKNKIDIPKLSKQKKSSLSYICEISSNDGELHTRRGTYIKYRYPDADKLKEIKEEDPGKARFIQDTIDNEIGQFEYMLSKPSLLKNAILDPDQTIFDIESFVDFIILQEFFKNVDGLRRSAYFHKKENGKFAMGPLWDFNLAFGNLNFYGMGKTSGWLYHKKHSDKKHAFWFKKLIRNEEFRTLLVARFKNLREPGKLLSDEYLERVVSEEVASLEGSLERDFRKWQDSYNFIEAGIMSTKEKGKCVDDHVAILKRWIQARITWMSEYIDVIHYKKSELHKEIRKRKEIAEKKAKKERNEKKKKEKEKKETLKKAKKKKKTNKSDKDTVRKVTLKDGTVVQMGSLRAIQEKIKKEVSAQ